MPTLPTSFLSWLPLFACISIALNEQGASAEIDFAHDVVPIFRKHCAECHTGEAKKGGLSLNDRESLLNGSENGGMVTIGNSQMSYLIELVTSTDLDIQMPPPKGSRLSSNEVSILRRWIDDGLKWEDGFAFKKPAYEPPLAPRQPILPPATENRNHPIDRIIDQYMSDLGLPRTSSIDDLSFLRRSSLDLIGLLPNPEVVQQFSRDHDLEKRQRWIQNLLDDDIGYADHWLTFWNDLLRNDYSGTGFITGGRKQISRWLYQSLVENKPFDQFARELIAPPSDESRGFIDGIKWRGEVSAGQTIEIQFAQNIAQCFLGINMKCASCHDSFIDRWKLNEAYGLAAIYASTTLDIARCDKATGEQAQPAWIFPELGNIEIDASREKRLEQLAALMTTPQNGRFARTLVNRLWYRMMGRGIVHPVDSMQTEPWSHDLLDHLASYFVDNQFDLKTILAYIATSEAYQSQSQILFQGMDDQGYQYNGPRAKRMTSEQFVDAVWTITGAAPTKFDAPVFRGVLDEDLVGKIRLTGKWIWGEVEKPDKPEKPVKQSKSMLVRKNFSIDQPAKFAGAMFTSNCDAVLFVNNRKIGEEDDPKSIQLRLIHPQLKNGMNSISIVANSPKANMVSNGIYFEARIRLLDGKTIILSSDENWEWTTVPAAMNEKRLAAMDKDAFKAVQLIKPLPDWTQSISTHGPTILAQASAVDDRMVRASLMKSDFLMRTLGRPNRDQIVSMRPNDLTTLEAVDLANGQSFADSLEMGAKKLTTKQWSNSVQLVSYVYRLALTREPTDKELAIATKMVGDPIDEQGIQDLMWAICMMPEFQYVR